MRRWWPTNSDEPTAPWWTIARRLVARGAVQGAGEWALASGRTALALDIARQALTVRRDPVNLRAAARIAFAAAELEQAHKWVAELQRMDPGVAGDHALLPALAERRAVLARLHRPSGQRIHEPVSRRVLCLLAFSLPYTSNGYATRSHGLLSAVARRGWDVIPCTRPGYPGDSDPAFAGKDLPPSDVVGGLRYGRLLQSSRRQLGQFPYIGAAADEIGRLLLQARPQLVHAASNYMTALPACLAAREAGVPFVYEVRGFWDVTRISSDPAFEHSTECRYLRLFERELLQKADAIITLTLSMKSELVRRGADDSRIVVAPNAVDTDALKPALPDDSLARELGLAPGIPVIGYAGSFVDYEGLDDLVDAFAQLRAGGTPAQLLLVGDGLAQPSVKERIAAHGLQSHVKLTGRVPHADIPRYYALMDVCPFPRKPWPVCELVSPLKPFEAMALGKAVVVSSVAATAESIEEGVNGHVFAKGDVADLAASLKRLIDQPQAAHALGRSARDWVCAHRGWQHSALAVEQAYRGVLDGWTATGHGR